MIVNCLLVFQKLSSLKEFTREILWILQRNFKISWWNSVVCLEMILFQPYFYERRFYVASYLYAMNENNYPKSHILLSLFEVLLDITFIHFVITSRKLFIFIYIKIKGMNYIKNQKQFHFLKNKLPFMF